MQNGRPKIPLHKIVGTLALITPAPLGLGLSNKEAAERIGIHRKTIEYHMKCFKRDYPVEYQKWIDKQKDLAEMEQLARSPVSLDSIKDAVSGQNGDSLSFEEEVKWKL